MTHLAELTAAEAAARMKAGELTALAYADAFIARVAEREADVKAWVHLDPEYVRAAARAADERRREGRAPGPLNGIPVGIKDVINTADMPTQNGCAYFKDHQPEHDAGCIVQLRARPLRRSWRPTFPTRRTTRTIWSTRPAARRRARRQPLRAEWCRSRSARKRAAR